MQYPLPERIGEPELFTGREKEFKLLDRWLNNIPKRISKSRAILARRKSGKTAIVQRIFNRLWNANKSVIPFYYNFPERKMGLPELAVEYFRTFVSQYISFIERDENPVKNPLSLEKIREYGKSKSIDPIVMDCDMILWNKEMGMHGQMWNTAYTAPHRYAAVFDIRILVIFR